MIGRKIAEMSDMSGRQSNGWGNCVWCGEMLKPEDAEPWSDRCPFCLAWTKLKRITNERVEYIERMIKTVTTEEWKAENDESGEKYWAAQLTIYESIDNALLKILINKRKNSYDTSWPTKIKPSPINEITLVWENVEGLTMTQKGERMFTLKEIKGG